MSASHGTSRHGPDCECRRCQGLRGAIDGVPFEPGNTLALKHGIHSERQVKPLATIQKRRFLRQNGLRKSDIDGIGLALLDSYARAQSKVELLDLWFAEHGIVDEDGRPQPSLSIYFTALAAATKTLGRLHDHLRRQAEVDPFDRLNDYLVSEGIGRRVDGG